MDKRQLLDVIIRDALIIMAVFAIPAFILFLPQISVLASNFLLANEYYGVIAIALLLIAIIAIVVFLLINRKKLFVKSNWEIEGLRLLIYILIVLDAFSSVSGYLIAYKDAKLPMAVFFSINTALGVLIFLQWHKVLGKKGSGLFIKVLLFVSSLTIFVYSFFAFITMLERVNSTYGLIYLVLPLYVIIVMPAIIFTLSFIIWGIINFFIQKE